MKTQKILQLTDDQFYDKYTPIKNHIDDNASFDGCMFETYGEELEHVFKHSKKGNKVWTIIEGDGEEKNDDGEVSPTMYIVSGFHIVNRIGFLITKESYKVETEVKLD